MTESSNSLVYPLKAIYSGAIDFFSGGYLDSYFAIKTVDDLRSMFLIFGAGYVALAGTIVLLNRHALSLSEPLGLSELEIFDTRTQIQYWTINVIVPIISVVLALTLPGKLVVAAGIFYCVFGIAMPAHATQRGRHRERLIADGVV